MLFFQSLGCVAYSGLSLHDALRCVSPLRVLCLEASANAPCVSFPLRLQGNESKTQVTNSSA